MSPTSSERPDHTRLVAIGAAALVAVILASVVVLALRTEPDPDDRLVVVPIPTGDFEDRFQPTLVPGDCFTVSSLDAERVVPKPVDCTAVHDAEVYFVHELGHPIGAAYPGEDDIVGNADRICIEHFGSYVGADYFDSEFDFYHLHPTERSWTRLDDRTVTCAVTTVDGSRLRRSVRQIGR